MKNKAANQALQLTQFCGIFFCLNRTKKYALHWATERSVRPHRILPRGSFDNLINCSYIKVMRVEFDPARDAANQAKHGVSGNGRRPRLGSRTGVG
jgi:hypothetical protein